MNELVSGKQPANSTTGAIVRLTAPSQRELMRDLKRRMARGEVVSPGDLYLVQRGPQAGQVAIDVHLVLRRPADVPRWATMARSLGWVLIGLSALFGSVAWLLSALSAASLAIACVTVLVAFCVWVWARHGRQLRGRTEVEVIARVRTR